MAARVRRRFPWLGSIGPALTLANVVAILFAGLVASEPLLPTLTATGAAVLVARAADLHRPRLVLSIVEDLPGLLVAAAVATLVVVTAGPASVTFAVLALACLVLGHTAVYAVAHLLRRAGRSSRRVLVVGTGPTARRLTHTLLARPELGLRPVGMVGTGAEQKLTQARGLPLALLGHVSTLPRAMTETHVDTVVIALPGPAGDDELAALEGLLATPAEVYAVPAWFPRVRAHARHPRELVDDVPVVHLHRRGTSLPVRGFKRVVEVVVAVVTLATLLALAVVLAALVRIETGGVLVSERRIDERGRSGPLWRFRTRHVRSVARAGTTFSVAVSGRLGPVGRLLRRTRLDALPELLVGLLRRMRYAGGVPGGGESLTTAAHADEAQVDAGQLAS